MSFTLDLPTKSLCIAVLAMASASTTSFGAVIFEENFEGYANHAAFAASWSPNGSPPHTLSTSLGRESSRSVRLTSSASGGGVTNRWFKNLTTPIAPSDAEPLVFSFDFYLDPAGAATGWSGDWQLIDIRSYSGGQFGMGSIGGLVAMGVSRSHASFDTDFHDDAYFQGRILAPGHAVRNYHTLDSYGVAGLRTSGWHTLSAIIGASSTRFMIDGQLAEIVPVGVTAPINTVVLGADLPTSYSYWVDNIRLEVVPEPATIWLVGITLIALQCGRLRRLV